MAEQPKITVKNSRTTKADTQEALEGLFTIQPEETPDDVAVDNLLMDFKSMESAEVRINRVMPNNKLSYIATVHPNEFRFDDLRDVHDGGKFRLFIYAIDEDGKKVLRGSPQFEIEKPKRFEQPQMQVQTQASNDVANIVAQSMNGLGQLMIQGFENLGKMIVANQPERVDPVAMQTQLINQMVAMKQLMGGNEQRPAEDKNIVEKMIDTLGKGIELGKSMGEVRGETSTTDILMETIKSFGPALLTANQQQPQPQPQPQPVRQPPPIPHVPLAQDQPEIQPQNMQTESEDMNIIQQQKLKMGLSFLADAASRGLDQVTYAELAIDSMNDSELDAIFDDPEVLTKFSLLEPRINLYKEWFVTLLDTMRKMLTEENPDDITGQSSITSGDNHALEQHTEGDITSNS